MNQNSGKDFVQALYWDYVALDKNISATAEKHGLTCTETFQLVKMGEKRVSAEAKK